MENDVNQQKDPLEFTTWRQSWYRLHCAVYTDGRSVVVASRSTDNILLLYAFQYRCQCISEQPGFFIDCKFPADVVFIVSSSDPLPSASAIFLAKENRKHKANHDVVHFVVMSLARQW
jgi:hypothetical protein